MSVMTNRMSAVYVDAIRQGVKVEQRWERVLEDLEGHGMVLCRLQTARWWHRTPRYLPVRFKARVSVSETK